MGPSSMSLSSNGHRLSESEMIVDCPSQKPTLNITKAVGISLLPASINSFLYLVLGEAVHVRVQQRGVPRLLQQLSSCRPLSPTGRTNSSFFFKTQSFEKSISGGGQRSAADGEAGHSPGICLRESQEICEGESEKVFGDLTLALPEPGGFPS